ncbi:MAG TPA: periplasmic heavy metal sensor [Bryobacteraceae bacterium]|nr:periplasmic heavy metal sensor [Bryobacteraceae bacterium]
MLRTIAVLLLVSGATLFAQMPPGAWWNSPAFKEMNVSPAQMREIRMTVREYRPKLQELRGAVETADHNLLAEFNKDPLDSQKASAAIDQLISARSELTRTLSQMGLKLRGVLTLQQWQDLVKRFPPRNQKAAQPPTQ